MASTTSTSWISWATARNSHNFRANFKTLIAHFAIVLKLPLLTAQGVLRCSADSSSVVCRKSVKSFVGILEAVWRKCDRA